MAKPFYFWQTVSNKAKLDRFGLLKGQTKQWNVLHYLPKKTQYNVKLKKKSLI